MRIKGKFFLDNQDFFNAAWQWLIVENRPSCYEVTPNVSTVFPRGRCVYRKNTTSFVETCVIGAFIPDELLSEELLSGEVTTDIRTLLFKEEKISDWFIHVNEDLLEEVQQIHDNFNHLMFERRNVYMIALAESYNLVVPS